MTVTTENLAAPSGTYSIGGDLPVARLGYGTMQLPGEGVWGPAKDHDGALAVLRRAVEIGVTFFDTADSYGPEVAEDLLREALHPYADDVVIATKAGLTRQGPGVWTPGRPSGVPPPAVRALAAPSRRRADRPVPAAPHRRQRAGRGPGRRARRSCRTRARSGTSGCPRSPSSSSRRPARSPPSRPCRTSSTWPTATPSRCWTTATSNDIGFIPWFPLATGELSKEDGPLAESAKKHDATPSQLALAWLLKRSPVMLPIPGTTSIDHLESNTAAASIELTDEEFEALTAAV